MHVTELLKREETSAIYLIVFRGGDVRRARASLRKNKAAPSLAPTF